VFGTGTICFLKKYIYRQPFLSWQIFFLQISFTASSIDTFNNITFFLLEGRGATQQVQDEALPEVLDSWILRLRAQASTFYYSPC
jgi:hypothetical protein